MGKLDGMTRDEVLAFINSADWATYGALVREAHDYVLEEFIRTRDANEHNGGADDAREVAGDALSEFFASRPFL